MQPIPRVNPVQHKNLALRTMEASVATPPGTWFFKNVVSHFEPAMIKASGGKLRAKDNQAAWAKTNTPKAL